MSFSKEMMDHCVNSEINGLANHVGLLKVALKTTGNKDEIAGRIEQNYQEFNRKQECKNDHQDDQEFPDYPKAHIELADRFAELSGEAHTLELKVRYRLDLNNHNDLKLIEVLDTLGDDPTWN
jgi:hypothetical protein